MISKNKLAVAGVAAWLITYLLAKVNAASRQREARLHRKQVTTWEGEGGNLPPGQALQNLSAQELSSTFQPTSH